MIRAPRNIVTPPGSDSDCVGQCLEQTDVRKPLRPERYVDVVNEYQCLQTTLFRTRFPDGLTTVLSFYPGRIRNGGTPRLSSVLPSSLRLKSLAHYSRYECRHQRSAKRHRRLFVLTVKLCCSIRGLSAEISPST